MNKVVGQYYLRHNFDFIIGEIEGLKVTILKVNQRRGRRRRPIQKVARR